MTSIGSIASSDSIEPGTGRSAGARAEGRDAVGRHKRRIIVLPESGAARSPAETLSDEFAGVIGHDVIERVTAAARHALERSPLAATPDAVERLARERLLARVDAARARADAARARADAARRIAAR